MGGRVGNNQEFKGDINNDLLQATLGAGVSGTLQAQYTAADGTESWEDVPDGALVGPTNITFYCKPRQVMRFTSVAGGPINVV